jgi:hypothetical protein
MRGGGGGGGGGGICNPVWNQDIGNYFDQSNHFKAKKL